MSSPQLENGHTRVANELLEAIIRFDFSKREYQVLLAVIRKTYGYQKKTDELGGSQLAEMTGLHRQHVVATVAALVKKNVLVKSGGKHASNIGINKNYNEWGDTKTVSVQVTPKQCQGDTKTVSVSDTKTVSEVTPKQCHTKERKKEKENIKKTPPPLKGDLNIVGSDENKNRGGGEKILGTTDGTLPNVGERGAEGTEKIVRVQASNLIFQKEMTIPERDAAQNLLKSCGESAQDVLDVLAAAMVAGQVKKSPVAFLGGLVRRYETGTFDPAPAIHIKLEREKRQATSQRQKSVEQLSRVRALQEFEAFEARRKAKQKQEAR